MKLINQFNYAIRNRKYSFAYNSLWDKLHLDGILFTLILFLLICGILLLYSATDSNLTKIFQQLYKIIFGLIIMVFVAQIHPTQFKRWTITLFVLGIILLIFVKIAGTTAKGAQRWINLGIIRFQPSEIMKLAVPMIVSLLISRKPIPTKISNIVPVSIFIIIPCYLIYKQPDLSTSLIILFSGCTVFILAGIKFKQIIYSLIALISSTPILWNFMHDYQKTRVLTFLNPQNDPTGKGYHIIQSKIAIGSGGIFGKGWLNGTQSHLKYLPESATDFIFALCGEEFGILGCILLISICTLITFRTLYLSQLMNDIYLKLLCGTFGVTFYLYTFINIGMVSGIFPVVGSPLPLISYGGTSMLTIMVCFGIIMSANSHRKLAHEC
ncbi:MAG: rod shape-determining protein RodA [Legionellales bacterium]|nr:rod shape-determining protein RodA [Legionellales bacterium]